MQFLYPLMAEAEEDEFYNGYYRKQQNRGFKEMQLHDQQVRSSNHYEQYQEVYLDLISCCDSVLEIGCGSGGFLKFAIKHRPSLELYATEKCGENFAFVSECFSNISMVHNLDELNGLKFDCIFVLAVFEHLRDSLGFLVNIKKYLRTGGKLVLRLPNKNHPLVSLYSLDEFKKFMYIKQHYYTFTEKSIRILAENAGYSVDKFTYLQIWRLDNHLSWLRYKMPREFSNITNFLSKETLDSYDIDLIRNKTTDSYIVTLQSN